jgi:N-acetylglucosaminyldiphosphoundecaprenol N-acetyl-beta-D-mannosaminyltransferase
MVGVGAAYDFHTGSLRDSPQWMKRAGLQWFHRLMQEPRRLWWRYLKTNSIFLFLAVITVLRIRNFPLSEPVGAGNSRIGCQTAKP